MSAYGYTEREKSPRFMGSGSKWDGCELGYRPSPSAVWLRERPKEPGVYPVAARYDSGFWSGETRDSSADWAGWWLSRTVEDALALERRIPPVPEW